MVGCWPSSFLCVFMDRDDVEVNKHAKNSEANTPEILTKQVWSTKDLLHAFCFGFGEIFLAGHSA